MSYNHNRSDPAYILTLACKFKILAGDAWDNLCLWYNSADKPAELERWMAGEAQKFWRRVKPHREEFERAASSFYRRR
jgi:hypothetical protein